MRSKKYILLFLLIGALSAQNDLRFDFGADSLEVNVGETKEIEIKLLNDKNKLVDNPFYVYGQRKNLSVLPRISESGGKVKVTVKAHNPGRLLLTTQTVTVKRDDRVRGSLVINVPYPPIEKVAFSQTPSKLYTNTTTNLSAKVTDQAGLDRTAGTLVAYKSSDESIASFDELNNLITKKAGRITVSATAEGVSQSLKIKVVKNPARSVSISTNGVDEIRTGDVLRVNAKAVSGSRSFDDVPVYY